MSQPNPHHHQHHDSTTPSNMSPHVSHRKVPTGQSRPSPRGSSMHEDHHQQRADSSTDLASMDAGGGQTPPHNRRSSRSNSIDGEDALILQLRGKVQRKPSFDFSVLSSSNPLASQWTTDKRIYTNTFDDSDDDDPKASPADTLSESASPVKQSPTGEQKEGRLLIVANRLPVSMKVTKKKGEDGKDFNDITFSSSSGGLVSALGGCEMESRWIGWPGAEVRKSVDRESVRRKLHDQKCIPVFLTQQVCDPFYSGFCNSLLWPLFHYLPLPVESITTADGYFEAYKTANQAFADIVLQAYQEGDVVWIHDYHLMLLPHILRARHPRIRIGFFFHTPFPAFEIYRGMPARQELLTGVLMADLIGFHTPDYQRHFQDSCVRILGAEAKGNTVAFDGFTSKLGAFPIGIDPKRFIQTVETEQSKKIMEQYKKEFAGKKVLLGIDRLDYIKGIQHKIYALERLFEKHPQLAKEVVLVQIAVPSRTDVVEYQKLRASVHKLVGRVNGLYGGVGSVPLHYLDQSIPFDRMCALYRCADALVVTSVRDGMNLVAYEYIACQKDSPCTLILSEFAGAAQTLGDGPLQINPWSIASMCDAIYRSLTMPEAERRRRSESMFKLVTTQTSSAWARKFLTSVLEATNTPLNWLRDLQVEATSPNTTNEEWQASSKSAGNATPSESKGHGIPPLHNAAQTAART